MPSLIVLEGVRTIQATKGVRFLVDEADYGLVCDHSWRSAPSRQGKYYAGYTQSDTKAGPGFYVLMHRILTGAPEGMVVDHKNGDPTDNRRCNLRVCTYTQNQHNVQRARGTSKFKGVSWKTKERRWKAAIMAGGKRLYFECFNEIEAARWYDRKAREHFGEFAHTNEDMHGQYWLQADPSQDDGIAASDDTDGSDARGVLIGRLKRELFHVKQRHLALSEALTAARDYLASIPFAPGVQAEIARIEAVRDSSAS